jgi:lipopolysaccharide biosynthesis protein
LFTIYLIKLLSFIPAKLLNIIIRFKFLSKILKEILVKQIVPNEKLFKFINYGFLLDIPVKYHKTKKIIPIKTYNFTFKILKSPINSFINKKIAIFAHYDPYHIIDDYVLFYVNEIHLLGYIVIFTSANKIIYSEDQVSSLESIIIREGSGYDFTNWSCAFTAFPDLFLAEEILLCNDSVFGPINSLNSVHNIMDKTDCDFWGLSDNKEIIPHLQSYYLVFKRKSIQNKIFKYYFTHNFVSNRKEAIFLETNLTLNLFKAGLKPFSYVNSSQFPLKNINYLLFFWEPLIKLHGFPFIKRNLLVGSIPWIDMSSWQSILQETNYNTNLINNYLKRLYYINN